MISYHPAKFGGHRHRDSDMFLVAKGQNSRFSWFNQLLLFISKGHGLKAHRVVHHYIGSWSHGLKTAFEQIFENSFCQSVQKH